MPNATWNRALLFLVTVGCAAWLAAPAGANYQAARTIVNTTSFFQGSRATVSAPDSSEVTINNRDEMISSVWADDDFSTPGDSGIQQGITYDDNGGIDNNGGCPATTPTTLWFFTEKANSGNLTCFFGTTTGLSQSHLESLSYNSSSGLWTGYVDGVSQNITNAWGSCTGRACRVYAFGEDIYQNTGRWHAKFAGSGQTQWQYYNGSNWINITGGTNSLGTGWTYGGTFPGGIWGFFYSH